LLERSGAVVTLANRGDGGRGAMVTIGWQRPAVEAASLSRPLAEPRAGAGNN
jgi:hypothetical protein